MSQSRVKPSKELPDEHHHLFEWWESLKVNRGERATIRRASNIEQVMFNPGFHRLWRKLRKTNWRSEERVALIAGLAARVRDHHPGLSLAAQLGSSSAGRQKAVFSGLRFRRLLQTRHPNELLQACSRAIKFCERRIDLAKLANDVYWWDVDEHIQKKWAFDYYNANPTAD